MILSTHPAPHTHTRHPHSLTLTPHLHSGSAAAPLTGRVVWGQLWPRLSLSFLVCKMGATQGSWEGSGMNACEH